MNSSTEDRLKGECTPLMEAASAGHVDIVNLLISHGADVNAQSNSGNTPLMYGCAGGHEEVVKVLLEAGANVEDHNENGHTPLMEAASAGHVNVAKILLDAGAGINTHSNEFKESALTLACYKGHLDMVRFLLEAGADQEHKTDEMHTALMEASMDGHVEVARLLLDSGAQVNMPTDSFESPLTLAACGGHVDLAMLLIERGANIEEVNDEGYTPLMEAAREGHEEMVALLLSQGANINAQTEETQETALTLACCGGFLEVADFLIKAGADVELGASTPLMEAAQEGHLELVRYLLESNADVHAQTQTGDTALTYACENGHTDVADLLLEFGADLEHESEGGRTPLMKACRAGHLCTVQFLLSKNADVNRQTTNNDHTPLSLACAGGHLSVVELLLAQSADPFYKLKDNSTMLIEAAKGGHTSVVQLLLDYPHSIMMNQSHNPAQATLSNQLQNSQQPTHGTIEHLQQTPETQNQQCEIETNPTQIFSPKVCDQNSVSKINRLIFSAPDVALNTAEIQQIRNQPRPNTAVDSNENMNVFEKSPLNISNLIEPEMTTDSPPERDSLMNNVRCESSRQEQILQKQQILEELQRVERELQMKGAGHLFLQPSGTNTDFINSFEIDNIEENVNLSNSIGVINTDQIPQPTTSASDFSIENSNDTLNAFMNYQEANRINTALSFYKGFQANKYYIEGFKEGMKLEKQRMLKEVRCLQETQLPLPLSSSVIQRFPITNTFTNNATVSVITVPAPTALGSTVTSNSCNPSVNLTYSNPSFSNDEFCKTISAQPLMPIASCEVSQNAAISDRPKVKAIPKKDNKNARKTVQGMVINKLQQQHMALMAGLSSTDFQKFLEKTRPHCVQQVHQLQQLNQQLQSQLDQVQVVPPGENVELDSIKHHDGTCSFLNASQRNVSSSSDEGLKLEDEIQTRIDETAHIFESLNLDDINKDEPDDTKKIEVLENLQQLQNADQVQKSSPNDGSDSTKESVKAMNFLGFAGFGSAPLSTSEAKPICSHDQLDVPATPQLVPSPAPQTQKLETFETDSSTGVKKKKKDENAQANLLPQSNQIASTTQTATSVGSLKTIEPVHSAHHYTQSTLSSTNQVQVATQTQSFINNKPTVLPLEKKSIIASSTNIKGKKTKYLLTQQQASSPETSVSSHQPSSNFLKQNFHVDPKADKYTIENPAGKYPANQAGSVPFSCMDVDSETDSNHDTALTLACAGGHEELVELLLSRGSDIEHRDKKGFTPLILAATAGHQKVVEILLNHGADIEAQSERTKDTPLSLACSGGRYEVVELLLNRGANKEHRNVSDYTPLSLAASGGYVNIIKLLLSHGAEINSRTGSKLGISPLMLAAMNGHTAAVKLLLDMGSDINAQIETNRNTALTLACFQGRHEVVSLLLDRRANVEHRAKTGLTPLMEAASGGYVEVGRVLLNKGADVNATPVPSSRDTALTIAADKGHCRFVELLLSRGTQVEVKNKKGNSPLWLAANGGHLNVVDLLYQAGADIDSQDNRKVSCLMAAFRKGHIKVVKWMVNHVTQFPSDQEMTRYIATINDKELLERCQECVKIIRDAKETQAAKANKNATILLEELDMEKTREESKKAAAARKRERKKKKKLEKKEEKRKLQQENEKNEAVYENKFGIESKGKGKEDSDNDDTSEFSYQFENSNLEDGDKSADETTTTNQSSSSNNTTKPKEKKKEKKKKKSTSSNSPKEGNSPYLQETAKPVTPSSNEQESYSSTKSSQDLEKHPAARDDFEATGSETNSTAKGKRNHYQPEAHGYTLNTTKYSNSTNPKPGKRDEGWKEVTRKGQTDDSGKFTNSSTRSRKVSVPPNAISRVIGRGGSNINTIRTATGAHIEVDKQNKSGGERIITIRGSSEATKQAHVLIIALIKDPDIDINQVIQKTKISAITTSWDQSFSSTITSKLKVSSPKLSIGISTAGMHVQGNKPNYVSNTTATSNIVPFRTQTSIKPDGSSTSRVVTPRFISAAENKTMAQAFSPCNTKTTMSYTSAIMTSNHTMKNVTPALPQTTQSFAAKLTEMNPVPQVDPNYPSMAQSNHNSSNAKNVFKQTLPTAVTAVVSSSESSMKVSISQSNTSTISNTYTAPMVLPPSMTVASSHFTEKLSHEYSLGTFITSGNSVNPIESFTSSTAISKCISSSNSDMMTFRPFSKQTGNFSPLAAIIPMQAQEVSDKIHSEYSLFDDTFSKVTQQSMWGCREHEMKKCNFADVAGVGISNNSLTVPESSYMQLDSSKIDLSKAPGYRGTSVYSPTSNNPKNMNVSDGKIILDAPVASSKPIQSANFQASMNYNRNDLTINTAVNMETPQAYTSQKDVNLNTNKSPYPESVIHKTMDAPQNMMNDYSMCNISPGSQTNMDENMYDENSMNYEMKKAKMNMLKNLSDEMPPNTQSLSSMQQNVQHHSQAPSTVMTPISMSQLNPRAPDFSSSLHPNPKPHVNMYDRDATMRQQIYPKMAPQQVSSNSIQNVRNQNRWSYSPQLDYLAHKDPNLGQLSYLNSYVEPRNLDMNNPDKSNMLASHVVVPTKPLEHRRVVPRPIGTERSWKNYNTYSGPGGDADGINWSDEQLTNSWSRMTNLDQNQMFANVPYNQMPPSDPNQAQVMDNTLQESRFKN